MSFPSTKIQTLRPNVSREDALRIFRSRGPEGLLRTAVFGPLRSIAEIYVPFRLFRTRITNSGGTSEKIFALETFLGVLELFEFEVPPTGDQLIACSSRNVLPITLDATPAREILIDKVRRIVFRQGFFKLRDIRIDAEPLAPEIYLPYWVAFFGRREQAHLAVLDATRRRLEGGKARHMVQSWLAGHTERVTSCPDM